MQLLEAGQVIGSNQVCMRNLMAQPRVAVSFPCRLDEEAIRDLEQVMRDASICGLGQAAPNPVHHLLTHFRQDL